MDPKPTNRSGVPVDSDTSVGDFSQSLAQFRELHGPTLERELREKIQMQLTAGRPVPIASFKKQVLAPHQPKTRGLGYILSRLRTTE